MSTTMYAFFVLLKIAARKYLQLHLLAKTHNKGPLLVAIWPWHYHLLPLNSLFLAILRHTWGLYVSSVHTTRRHKINIYTFPLETTFSHYSNRHIISFLLFTFFCLSSLTHLASSNRNRDNLISGICENCQSKLSGRKHHNHLKGLTAWALWI